MYHVILNKHVMHFIREAEYHYTIRNKTDKEKIKDLIECYQIIFNIIFLKIY